MRTLRERGFETASASSRRRARRRGRRPAEAAVTASSALNEAGRDLNRLILAHSGSLTFLGLTLGVFVTRKFLMVPIAVAACLAQEMAKERFRTALARKPRR